MEYTVRHAEKTDLKRISEIYAIARRFMEENGNPNQWGKAYPPAEQIEKDILEEKLYVIASEEEIHGVFFFHIGEDPTYRLIYDGAWRSETPYGTIHRIAGDGSGGILRTAVKFCKKRIGHLRIDTHEDNAVMQHALEKQGFQKRGMIYTDDGTLRIAYDLIEG